MQIKWLRFFSTLIICCMCNVANAIPVCKAIVDVDGQRIRDRDISEKPNFRSTSFTRYVCSSPEQSPYPSEKRCVRLTDIQLQSYAQAIQIAKNYAKERYNDDITCASKYYSCADLEDHVFCGNAGNTAHYEFVFDDITERFEPLYKKGIGTAFCKIYMGDDAQINRHHSTEYASQIGSNGVDPTDTSHSYNDYLNCEAGENLIQRSYQQYNSAPSKTDIYRDDLVAEQAVKLSDNLSNTFGYTARYNNYMVNINFHTLDSCPTTNIITRFKTQQINLDQNVTAWLGMYYARDHQFSKFKCDLAPQTCRTGEFFNPWEDILTCYADGVPVRFLFDDLSEGGGLKNRSASSMMQCMGTDGAEFDGRYCHGITRAQCDALSTKVPGGTDWNTNLDTCVLKSAATLDNMNQTIDLLETVVGVTVIAVATVATGGTVLGVIGAVGMATTMGVDSGTNFVQRGNARQYLADLSHCDNVDCARSLFDQYFNQISYYDEALDENMILSLDEQLSQKLDLFDESEQMKLVYRKNETENRDKWGKYLSDENIPTSVYIKDGADILKVVFTIMSLHKAPQALATGKLTNPFQNVRLAKTTEKILNLVDKIKKIVNSPAADKASNIYDLFDVATTVNDAL